jgi:hypothetical protein
MWTRGQLRTDPGTLEAGSSGEIELVVAYTRPDVTRAVLERAAVLASGLNVRVLLVAVHVVSGEISPGRRSCAHAGLVEQLVELCGDSPLPSIARVVLARSLEAGLQDALPPESTVLAGAPRRLPSGPEEALSRSLAAAGHKVIHVEVE